MSSNGCTCENGPWLTQCSICRDSSSDQIPLSTSKVCWGTTGSPGCEQDEIGPSKLGSGVLCMCPADCQGSGWVPGAPGVARVRPEETGGRSDRHGAGPRQCLRAPGASGPAGCRQVRSMWPLHVCIRPCWTPPGARHVPPARVHQVLLDAARCAACAPCTCASGPAGCRQVRGMCPLHVCIRPCWMPPGAQHVPSRLVRAQQASSHRFVSACLDGTRQSS